MLRRIGLVLICSMMCFIGLSMWWGLQTLTFTTPEKAFYTVHRWQPWGGPAWIPAATQTLPQLDAATQLQLLNILIRQYPLAAIWRLNRAEALSGNDRPIEEVLESLEVVTAINPGNPEIRWQAAMLAVQAGTLDTANNYLRELLTLQPKQNVERVVLVSRRWFDNPEHLLTTLLPDNPEALRELLPHAARWQDWRLANEVWQRLPESTQSSPAAVASYVDGLLHAGRGNEAAAVWRRAESGFAPETIFNGDFTRTFKQQSRFDWNIQMPKGSSVQRNGDIFTSAPASLHIHFEGTENLRLVRPEQYVAVKPGRKYRLQGWWKAEKLTTRALPHLMVMSHGPDQHQTLAHMEAPAPGNWDWQMFSAIFTVPETVELIRIQLRRLPTENLDRFIAGDLYIDDVAINVVKDNQNLSQN